VPSSQQFSHCVAESLILREQEQNTPQGSPKGPHRGRLFFEGVIINRVGTISLSRASSERMSTK